MKFVMVVPRSQLFPRLSPQGLLDMSAIDLEQVEQAAFFAEREYMEHCSHFKQVIPYLVLTLGDEVLCYQRQVKHSESRLGGLWTVGFGGHIEPIDRTAPEAREVGLFLACALRELHEETGLEVPPGQFTMRGFINSDATDVSSVHVGILYSVNVALLGLSREEITERVDAQAEPHRSAWRNIDSLEEAPEGGAWEEWASLAISGFGPAG